MPNLIREDIFKDDDNTISNDVYRKFSNDHDHKNTQIPENPMDVRLSHVYGGDGNNNGRNNTGTPPKEVYTSEEAMEIALMKIGPFGFYHRYVLILLCIPNIFAAMYSLNYVFVADQVSFRCVLPECEGADAQFVNASMQQLLPADACRRYAPLAGAGCLREHFHPHFTVPCERFVYETQDTIYAEFGLACNEWRRTLVGSVRNAALPFALLLTGYVSDGWGRRTAFCIFAGFAGALGVLKSFSPTYGVYLAMEFLEAALGYGFNSAAYVMAVELARPSLRAAFACATGVSYGLGGVALALAARRARAWRRLLRALHAPALLLPLYWLLLDESARWLHASRRRARALAVVKKAAQWNKVVLDEDLMKAIKEGQEDARGRERSQWRGLLAPALLLRMAGCGWCWAAAAFVYYGLTINSVSLSGDKYTNFALNMAMEIVASLLIVMALERFGRRRSISTAFLICGVTCVTPFCISQLGENARLALHFAGKLAITFAFNSLYVFTAELFPTPARSSALSAASLLGRLGSVLAPQTPLLSAGAQALAFGAGAASAAGVVLLAPETRRAPLPAQLAPATRPSRPPSRAPQRPPSSAPHTTTTRF